MSRTDQAVTVPMDVAWVPSWLSWVGCVTACLRALGVDCDRADVAGVSGYAFQLTIHKQLCPSGPTVCSWGALAEGIPLLGRSILSFATAHECHTGDSRNDRTREACRRAFDMVSAEIAAGRPCMIWGTYVPECGVVVGIDGDSYVVKSYREATGEPQPPIRFDDLDAPGGPYALAFPGEVRPNPAWRDRYPLWRAAQLLEQSAWWHPHWTTGLAAAYGAWVAAMESGDFIPFGAAYNAQCWAESRALGRDFLGRVAARCPFASEPLGRAAEAYGESADHLARVAGLFPFPPRGEAPVEAATRQEAAEALRAAQMAETRAHEALVAALAADWPLQ